MPIISPCSSKAASPSAARTGISSNTTAGTQASGGISNWRPASMSFDQTVTEDDKARSSIAAARAERRAAVALLRSAAAPERRHLIKGTCWLITAALLEAMSPLLGKTFIDSYLLPHRLVWPNMVGLLAGALAVGYLAATLRYLQLARLAGVAMRSVRRLREDVYSHVIRLPMTFFDKAITGQLVSRVTKGPDAS